MDVSLTSFNQLLQTTQLLSLQCNHTNIKLWQFFDFASRYQNKYSEGRMSIQCFFFWDSPRQHRKIVFRHESIGVKIYHNFNKTVMLNSQLIWRAQKGTQPRVLLELTISNSVESAWLKMLGKIRCSWEAKKKLRVFPGAYHVACIEIEIEWFIWQPPSVVIVKMIWFG